MLALSASLFFSLVAFGAILAIALTMLEESDAIRAALSSAGATRARHPIRVSRVRALSRPYRPSAAAGLARLRAAA